VLQDREVAGYDAELGIERLREACGQRYDLLRAFVDLQLRAALAGNGISPPVRRILMGIAERLGLSGLEFAHMEASLARGTIRLKANPPAWRSAMQSSRWTLVSATKNLSRRIAPNEPASP